MPPVLLPTSCHFINNPLDLILPRCTGAHMSVDIHQGMDSLSVVIPPPKEKKLTPLPRRHQAALNSSALTISLLKQVTLLITRMFCSDNHSYCKLMHGLTVFDELFLFLTSRILLIKGFFLVVSCLQGNKCLFLQFHIYLASLRGD